MARSYFWQWHAKAPPDALWPLVTDTDQVNRAIGLAPWHFAFEADPKGGKHLVGRARYLGVDLSWDEHPFEWRENAAFSNERIYHSGPFRRIATRTTLEPEDGGTRLTLQIDVDTRGLFGGAIAAWQIGRVSRRGFDRVYRALIQVAELKSGDAFAEQQPSLSPVVKERVSSGAVELAKLFPPPLVEKLATLIASAPDRELVRLRPFALARAWGEDRLVVLRLLLHATRVGLLDSTWRILCPHCRGSSSGGRLRDVRRDSHCDACEVSFETDFSRTLELAFTTSAQIRPVRPVTYCIGGPAKMPHIAMQQRVAAGKTKQVPLALAPGPYRLRSPSFPGALNVRVVVGGAAEARHEPGASESSIDVAPSFQLALHNPSNAEARFVLERSDWVDDAATADVVTSLQEFRDLFSDDVLRAGEELDVSELAFLFTDLKNSTAMYERIGDGPAFALVRSHFEALEEAVKAHDGAVVKTIGDAVMAVFKDPGDAVRAARAMFERIAALPPSREGDRLTLKVGLHAGPCLAVNLNDRLDYFGTTVNLAARVQSESKGGDLVVTREVADDPAVRELLESAKQNEAFATRVKGLSETIEMRRVWFIASKDEAKGAA